MARLTEDKIRKLRWDSAKRTKAGNVPKFQPHNDSEVGGLHIRLYPPKANGQSSKVFYLKYGADVDRKVFKIGSWGEWTLDDARAKARKIRRDFSEHGVDPNQAKRKKIQQAGAKPTVKELVEKYLAAHPSPAVWSESYARTLRSLSNNFTAFEYGMLAEDLTKDEIRPLFLKIKARAPAQAKQFRGLVKRMYDWAMDEDEVPEMLNPGILVRSKSKAKNKYSDPATNERDRHLECDKEEGQQLFQMLQSYNPLYTTIAKLYILLGFRNTELRTARWEHIDLKSRIITNVNPSTKGLEEGEDPSYEAYLCDMAIHCLRDLGLGKIKAGPIFPAAGLHKSATEPRSQWKYWDDPIRKNPAMPQCKKEGTITIHDLRRTGYTWLHEMGHPSEERDIWKGSKPQGDNFRHYAKANLLYVRKRCTLAIEERLLDVLAGREKTMFDPWRNPKQTTGPAS
jgi:integrase